MTGPAEIPAPAGCVVLVTSSARSQARLLDDGHIWPDARSATLAAIQESRKLGAFYSAQVVPLSTAAAREIEHLAEVRRQLAGHVFGGVPSC